MDVSGSLRLYLSNFTTALSFALLLVFVFPFSFFEAVFSSSGTLLLDYSFLKTPFLEWAGIVLLILVFLFFYSVLISLMVFAVRRELSNVKINYYLREKIHKFAFKYFFFLVLFVLLGSLVGAVLVNLGFPVFALNFVIALVSLAFFFLPQTIVVDEESLYSSILTNFDFIKTHFSDVVRIFVVFFFMVLGLQVVEFLVDSVVLVGNFFSLIVSLVFVVPLLEIVKTKLYMDRFDIVRSYDS